MRRKRLLHPVPPLALISCVALLPAMTAGATAERTIPFTDIISGASISATQSAFSVHDSFAGDGAGVQTTRLTESGGSDTTMIYYAHATNRSKDTFTIGAPDADGNAALTGKGSDISGTGRLAGVRSTFTFAGTVNVKTGSYKVRLKGVYRLAVFASLTR